MSEPAIVANASWSLCCVVALLRCVEMLKLEVVVDKEKVFRLYCRANFLLLTLCDSQQIHFLELG
jgi:hypothetical protein